MKLLRGCSRKGRGSTGHPIEGLDTGGDREEEANVGYDDAGSEGAQEGKGKERLLGSLSERQERVETSVMHCSRVLVGKGGKGMEVRSQFSSLSSHPSIRGPGHKLEHHGRTNPGAPCRHPGTAGARATAVASLCKGVRASGTLLVTKITAWCKYCLLIHELRREGLFRIGDRPY